MAQIRLCDRREALHQYLDSLLAEIPPLAEAAVMEQSAPAPDEQCTASPNGQESRPQARDGGIPQWAHAPFKVLMFQAGQVRMAAPLIMLGGVVRNGAVARMPGLPDWCRGVLQHRGRQIPVIDAGVLQSDHRDPVMSGTAPVPCHILLADGRYALACESVLEVVTVAPEEVRWRRGGGRRPWYGGIITAHMCALLDVEALCGMLQGMAEGE